MKPISRCDMLAATTAGGLPVAASTRNGQSAEPQRPGHGGTDPGLSLLKNVVGVGIGLQLIAPEFMGRSEYIADVHDRRDINGIFRHGQRA
jgi:hypothetical protein